MTKLTFWIFAVTPFLRAHSILEGKEALTKNQIGTGDEIKVSSGVDFDSEISTQAYGYEPPTEFNSTIPDLEIRALYDLYYTTYGEYWYWLDYHYYYGNIWNFDGSFIDPCGDHWQGLTCTCSGSGTCHITEIRLSGYDLYGYIPDTIEYLSELEVLDLSSQYSLYGYIPNSITKLNKLQKLWLYDNALSGTIPYYIGDMSALTDVRMAYQMGWFTNGLYSWIPQSITQLKNLTFLSLHHNMLSGELPEDIGELANLVHLDISHNIVYSSLPDSFTDLESLQYCDLSVNYLWGSLPEALGNLDQLTMFDIRYNYRMSGTIPDSITQWTQIESLRLSDNLFSGTIPAALGDSLTELTELNLAINRLSGSLPNLKNLTKLSSLDILGSGFAGAFGPQIEGLSNLQYLRIASNFFDSGSLPAEMSTLTSLKTLYYNDCELTGTIPEWLYDLTELSELYLENNKLEGTLSESIGKLTKLGLFNINNNKLTGPLPDSFAEAVSMRDIHLEDNQFSGTLPSSLYRTCTANLWCSVYLSNNMSLPEYAVKRLLLLPPTPVSLLRSLPENLLFCSSATSTPYPGPKITSGSSPVKPLSFRNTLERRSAPLSAFSTLPSKRLPLTSNRNICFIAPSGGSDPDKSLCAKASCCMEVRAAMEEGIVPLRRLPTRLKIRVLLS